MIWILRIALYVAIFIECSWEYVSRVLFGDDDDPPFGYA